MVLFMIISCRGFVKFGKLFSFRRYLSSTESEYENFLETFVSNHHLLIHPSTYKPDDGFINKFDDSDGSSTYTLKHVSTVFKRTRDNYDQRELRSETLSGLIASSVYYICKNLNPEQIAGYELDDLQKSQCLAQLYLNTTEEIVDWIATNGTVLLPLPRSIIHSYNLLHRGVGMLLLDPLKQQIFVHRRASTKRLFPSMLDMFIGGVCSHNEGSVSTLVRELKEECGLNILQDLPGKLALDDYNTPRLEQHEALSLPRCQVQFLGDLLVQTDRSHCLVDTFLVHLSPEMTGMICFPDGEIEWGEWMTMNQLSSLLADDGDLNFVPDGMQVLHSQRLFCDRNSSFLSGIIVLVLVYRCGRHCQS